MRYQFGGVLQTKMNLTLWNLYIVGLLELYITSLPSEDVRKTANWDSLFETYKVKISSYLNLQYIQPHN